MKPRSLLSSLFFLLVWSLPLLYCSNREAKEVPSLKGPVMDEVGVLSPSFSERLTNLLLSLNEKTGIQFQLYFFEDLEDETIESYSIKVTDQWRLGSEKEDKGILFLLALRNKKMRLEIGQGLEGDLTDLYAKRILDNLRPYLKQSNYEEASKVLISQVFEKLGVDPSSFSELKPKRTKKNSLTGNGLFLIFFLFIFLSGLQRILPVSGRHYSGRRRPFDIYPGGGGFGGGSSSGGGWSGGGGGFSGGGASGDW